LNLACNKYSVLPEVPFMGDLELAAMSQPFSVSHLETSDKEFKARDSDFTTPPFEMPCFPTSNC